MQNLLKIIYSAIFKVNFYDPTPHFLPVLRLAEISPSKAISLLDLGAPKYNRLEIEECVTDKASIRDVYRCQILFKGKLKGRRSSEFLVSTHGAHTSPHLLSFLWNFGRYKMFPGHGHQLCLHMFGRFCGCSLSILSLISELLCSFIFSFLCSLFWLESGYLYPLNSY